MAARGGDESPFHVRGGLIGRNGWWGRLGPRRLSRFGSDRPGAGGAISGIVAGAVRVVAGDGLEVHLYRPRRGVAVKTAGSCERCTESIVHHLFGD